MINVLQNQSRLQSSYAVGYQTTPQLGTISTFDPNYYTAKVLLQPGDVLTNDIPVITSLSGNNWGISTPPVPGQMCVVIFIGGSPNNGVVVGLGYNDDYRPMPTPAGEIWLVHQSGASIKFTNDGKLLVDGNEELNIQAKAIAVSIQEALELIAKNITLNAQQKIDISSQDEVDVTATNLIKLKAQDIQIIKGGLQIDLDELVDGAVMALSSPTQDGDIMSQVAEINNKIDIINNRQSLADTNTAILETKLAQSACTAFNTPDAAIIESEISDLTKNAEKAYDELYSVLAPQSQKAISVDEKIASSEQSGLISKINELQKQLDELKAQIPQSSLSNDAYILSQLKNLQAQQYNEKEYSGLILAQSLEKRNIIEPHSNYPNSGWADILGDLNVRGTGGASPAWTTFRNGINAYSFSASSLQEIWINFHMPHDYMIGTMIYPHVHWSTTGTNTGSVVWRMEYTFARGYSIEAFPATATTTITQAFTGTAYTHMIAEPAEGAGLLLANLEPDTLILCRFYRDAANPADTQTQAAFVFNIDLHYQTEGFTTNERNRPFTKRRR